MPEAPKARVHRESRGCLILLICQHNTLPLCDKKTKKERKKERGAYIAVNGTLCCTALCDTGTSYLELMLLAEKISLQNFTPCKSTSYLELMLLAEKRYKTCWNLVFKNSQNTCKCLSYGS